MPPPIRDGILMKRMHAIVLIVVGIIVMGGGIGLSFILSAAAGIGTALVGLIIVIIGVLKMAPEKGEKEMVQKVSPHSQFLCPNCNAVVSLDDDRCPKCGKEFVPEMVRCPKCSAMVSVYEESCPKCGFLFVEKEYGICPKCGAHIDVNATECPHCGEKIWSALRPPQKILACPSCHSPVSVDDEVCPKC